MSDLIMILTGAISLVTIILIGLLVWRGSTSNDDDEEDDEMLEDMVAMPEGKIGAKKRKKLEMKAEKRAQRERDLEDREERRQKQALDEERRKQEEQREKELEAERKEKVVILEDLAAKFQLKTQECIDRVQALLADETLVGVIDDRGKFIYITRQELEEVAHFIKQRGRVSISELVDSSNSLINLTPAA
ncbi:hypothetical protein HPB51_020287 [Rhipicephalus microplus]|uniref:DDRGK domain-containing protein 1 n=1 Tax=Rhipicephalus microplus TaxID=6941 RepID=A0A9J6DBP2_RHIMP|nr:hypothetical protein HPB51_020287 [Rhipicephalus microplus]